MRISTSHAFVQLLPSVIPRRSAAMARVRVCDSCPEQNWRTIAIPDNCLRLSLTLPGGQSFRWIDLGLVDWRNSRLGRYREWAGVLNNKLYILRQAEKEPAIADSDELFFRLHAELQRKSSRAKTKSRAARPCTKSLDSLENELKDFFQLNMDMRPINSHFCNSDENFRELFPFYRGARLLRQAPAECLFSFICSSNNNIKRITNMVTHLGQSYGKFIAKYRGHAFYSFPTVCDLAQNATEQDLREAGFGYRAKFIVGTARMLQSDAKKADTTAENLLLALRQKDRVEVAKELTRYPGIGRKVAGCVALMSLDQLGEIPCDTHVWQIAIRYMPSLKSKSLTDRVYDSIGDFFRTKFGPQYAGLAHNMLFISELSDFKQRRESLEQDHCEAKNHRKRKAEAAPLHQPLKHGRAGSGKVKTDVGPPASCCSTSAENHYDLNGSTDLPACQTPSSSVCASYGKDVENSTSSSHSPTPPSVPKITRSRNSLKLSNSRRQKPG